MLREIKNAHIGRQPNRIESSGVQPGVRRGADIVLMLRLSGVSHWLAVPHDWPPAAQQRQHCYGPVGSYGTHNGDSLDAGPHAMKPVAR